MDTMDCATFMEACKKEDLDMFRNFKSRCKPQLEIFYKEAEEYFQQLERYRKTGEFSPVEFSILNATNEESQEECTESDDSQQNLPKTRGGRIPLKEAKNSFKPNELFQIQKEKLSIMNSESAREEMLSPSMIPPRTRTTRTKTRKDQEAMREESSKRKDSNIIIEKTPIPMVELTDDEDGNVDSTIKSVKSTRAATNAEAETTRSTRTKTRRDAKVSEEIPVETRSTRTKTRAQAQQQIVQTEKKRSLSNSRPAARTSSSASAAQLNTSDETVYEDAVSTLETETEPNKENANTTKDIEPRVQIKTKQIAKPKRVFNPFEDSPVKKKVEALEKWGSEQSSSPNRTPRSDKKSSETSKMYTPTGFRFMPLMCSTIKVNKCLTPQAKEREAILQAQSEDERKKREAVEKEKQRLYEQQKQKDERAKQLKAEKLQKQREEQEKERILNKEKAIQSLRKKEEALKTQEIRNRQFPQYMVTEAPPLPTEDCYDSDDESVSQFLLQYRGQKIHTPSWATASALRKGQKIMFASGQKLKNTFYCCQARTVDLREIFEVIDPRELMRTSNAIWRKPPRYTLMPIIPEFDEQDESDLYFSF